VNRAAALSLLYLLALLLGVVQQLVIAFYFRAGTEAGLYFLSLSVPGFVLLLFGESLNFSLLPQLLSAREGEKATLVARFLGVAAGLSVLALALTLLAGALSSDAKDRWGYFALLATVSAVGTGTGMLAAVCLVWHQHNHVVVRSALIHLVPTPVICVAAWLNQTALGLACGTALAGSVQLAILLHWAPGLRASFRQFFTTFGRRGFHMTGPGAGLALKAIVMASSVPMLQMLDRVTMAVGSVSDTAATSYAWALTMGLANLISRGQNLVYSLRLASTGRPAESQENLFRVPLFQLLLGSVVGLAVAGVASTAPAMAPDALRMAADAVHAIWPFWLPQLLSLGAITALGAFYRLANHFGRGDNMTAAILGQPWIHLLSFLVASRLPITAAQHWVVIPVCIYLLLMVRQFVRVPKAD
jgi:hypothetical protein